MARKLTKKLIVLAVAIVVVMLLAITGLTACNTNPTLVHQVDNLGQQIYAVQNESNPSVADIDALLAELAELRAEVVRLEGENATLLTRIAGYETQLKELRERLEGKMSNGETIRQTIVGDIGIKVVADKTTASISDTITVTVKLRNLTGNDISLQVPDYRTVFGEDLEYILDARIYPVGDDWIFHSLKADPRPQHIFERDTTIEKSFEFEAEQLVYLFGASANFELVARGDFFIPPAVNERYSQLIVVASNPITITII